MMFGPVVKVADGFRFLEGPVWIDSTSSLVFTDIPGDRIYQCTDGLVEELIAPSNMANGLALDRDGALIACEHATSRVTRRGIDGVVTVLASHYGDYELNSPNDVVVSSRGEIYFTDPTYGRTAGFGVERAQELTVQGVYQVSGDPRRPVLVADDFAQPNGLCFTEDETELFVNDTERRHIRRFRVEPDGSLGGGEIFFEFPMSDQPGDPDGMKIDARGNVMCTGPSGIWVLSPDARVLHILDVPEPVANFAWGGSTRTDLWIAASTSLYRAAGTVGGLAGGQSCL